MALRNDGAVRVDSLTLLTQSANRLHQSLARRPLQKRQFCITTDTDLCMFHSSGQNIVDDVNDVFAGESL